MPSASSQTPNAQRSLLILASLVLVIASLYWAQKIILPLALALMLTFLLTPAVSALQRRGLPRVPAVLLVVALALGLVVGVGWIVASQVQGLARTMPEHKDQITAKLSDLQQSSQGVFQGLVRMSREIAEELQRTQDNPDLAGGRDRPIPVVVKARESDSLTWFPVVIGPALETLATAGLILILVIFMLINREDLRNRLLSLIGRGRLTAATRALDEASRRISRFLMTQLLINATFGFVWGISLWLIPGNPRAHGVDYAFLWGFLAFLLRFVPYLGTWFALLLPLLLTIATFPGWTAPLLVLGIYLVLELMTANVIEPLLFGHSAGVSPVALLLAAAFWTWLWGPLGLVLSTPLTVCLLVIGRYVPHLEFLDVLLGDEPVLGVEFSYYQRLLARDEDEATDLVEEHLQHKPVEDVYDDLLLPGLMLAKRDKERGELPADDEAFVYQVTGRIVSQVVGQHQHVKRIANGQVAINGDGEALKTSTQRVLVFGCPARDEADELALRMFAQALDCADCRIEVFSPKVLTSEVVDRIHEGGPALLCIAALPPGGLALTRYLCKRVRAEFHELPILVGRWCQKENTDRMRAQLLAAGATHVATTLRETCEQAKAVIPFAAPVETLAAH